MQQSDVNENRSDEAPVLALIDQGIPFGPERQQVDIVHRAAGQGHQHEDRNIEAEENVRKNRTATPDGLQKLDVGFADHCLRSCCSFSAISRAAARATSSWSGLKEIAATTACPPPP